MTRVAYHVAMIRSASSLICSALLGVFALSLISCDSPLKPIEVSSLEVSPNPVVIEAPPLGMGVATSSLMITNRSHFDITINEITLVEDDDNPELTLISAEPWSGARVIAAGARQSLEIQWENTDATSDQATLLISSTAGLLEVPITTAEPEARLALTLDPEGMLMGRDRAVTLSMMNPSTWTSLQVDVQSIGLSPLTLGRFCLSSEEGDCLNTLGPFRLCEGRDATPATCFPPVEAESLSLNETRSVSVLFERGGESAGAFANADLIISSNDASQHPLTVKIHGAYCLPGSGEGCSSYYSLGSGSLSLGSQTMTAPSGEVLRGSLKSSAHLSFDSKRNIYLSGSLTP